ncbi:MAG: PaaI family thioesterase [Tannerellaceae bacterium]|nr:PaaI family thioesterase [Tannerellaceae bacterium]
MTVGEFFEGDKFALMAGVELLEVGNGYARARMEILPVHLNGGGVCQGGAIFTLADLAFAAATNSHAQLTFSITSSINFFRSESCGYLYAEAREAFSHKRLSNCEVKVTNEAGETVATFCGTGYRKEARLPFEPVV